MAYRLAIFDLGGVAVEVDSDRLVHQVSQLVGRTFEDVQDIIYHDELLLPFELGRIHATVYYEGLAAKLKMPWTYEQFVRAWNGIFRENTGTTAIMKRLSQQHRLIALTNTNALHLAHLKSTVSSLSVFEHWIASCDVGLRKPDPQFYRFALERVDVAPHEAVYVDDRPEMVEAGTQIGLTAIRFESHQQLERDLKSFGVSL